MWAFQPCWLKIKFTLCSAKKKNIKKNRKDRKNERDTRTRGKQKMKRCRYRGRHNANNFTLSSRPEPQNK